MLWSLACDAADCAVECGVQEGRLSQISLRELYGGARINYVFHELYARGKPPHFTR